MTVHQIQISDLIIFHDFNVSSLLSLQCTTIKASSTFYNDRIVPDFTIEITEIKFSDF